MTSAKSFEIILLENRRICDISLAQALLQFYCNSATPEMKYKKLIRRWDSERKLFYDILHVLQSTIDSHIGYTVHSVYCKPEAKHHKKNPSQR